MRSLFAILFNKRGNLKLAFGNTQKMLVYMSTIWLQIVENFFCDTLGIRSLFLKCLAIENNIYNPYLRHWYVETEPSNSKSLKFTQSRIYALCYS